ncbi:MAG TPA: EamA family transporter [Citreicella sp.]|jgi:drug/metabolite transporter (DMT)-like permease|nr:EamA family transporter [Citreicella sp.]
MKPQTAPLAAPLAAPQPDRPLLGALLMLGFCATAPLIDVGSKLATRSLPVAEITVARFVVQGVLMLALALVLRIRLRLTRRELLLTVARAALSLIATIGFVGAMVRMPIADALAIAQIEPFILMFLGWALLSESVGPRRILASVVGFAGALLVVQPGLATYGIAAVLPLVTAVSFAGYMLVTRQLRSLAPVAQQATTAMAAVVIGLPFLWIMPDSLGGGAVWPEGAAWLYLGGMGMAATLAHIFLTYALRLAPSALIAPLGYVELASATLLGWLVFGDFPAPMVWAGIALIVASGLYLIHREQLAHRRPQGPASPPL